MLRKNTSGEACGLVSNVQRYSIHDGPGIRTSVFFTGCALRCKWCGNPETVEFSPRLGVFPQKCLTRNKCGLCVGACPKNGESGFPVKFDDKGILQGIDASYECRSCLRCAEVCPPRAIKLWGEDKTVGELMYIIESDRDFYNRSGGGVTLTGGEVMLQWEFASLLLEACNKASIHTCVETALNCPAEHIEQVAKLCDFIICDIKHMDSAKHREFTGAGNELILSNVRRAAHCGKPLVIRTPVVPGYNDGEADIRAIAAFIKNELGSKVLQYQLLPFHRLGGEKYDALGLRYPMEDVQYDPPEYERKIHTMADMLRREFGVPAAYGADNLPVVED